MLTQKITFSPAVSSLADERKFRRKRHVAVLCAPKKGDADGGEKKLLVVCK